MNLENMRNKLFGTQEKARMLVGIFQDHNRKVETLVGDDEKKGAIYV